MARCKSCDFNLDHHNELSAMPGHCDNCGRRVCFRCGCTEEAACTRGPLACSWTIIVFGETDLGRIGMGLIPLDPGLCSFCFNAMAAAAYADAVAANEESSVELFR
jgi:hypothetical protein